MPSSVPLFTSVIIIILTIINVSCPLPLRPVGVDKSVEHPGYAEKRELVLCWVIQINTHARCTCGPDHSDDEVTRDDADDEDRCGESGCHSNGEAEGDNLMMSAPIGCCSGRRQIWEHVAALSDEVDLEIHHSFGQFHDHFLLCHKQFNQSEQLPDKNPPFTKSKSDTLWNIHRQHSDLRLKNRELFNRYKQDVEQRLHNHEEILWFSSEHVHQRHSRSIIPPQLDLEKLQLKTPSLRSLVAVSSSFAREPKLRTRGDEAIHVRLSEQELFYQNNKLSNSEFVLKDQLPINLSERISLPSVTHDSAILNNLSIVDTYRHINNDRILPFISKKSISLQSHLLKLGNTAENSLHGDQTIGAERLSLAGKLKGHGRNRHSRNKRSISNHPAALKFNDPAYPRQWHLKNLYNPNMDINVTDVWRYNYTGRGVTVSVVDDGLEWKNPDLKMNYNIRGSWDMNDNDPDPSPKLSTNPTKTSNHHGTRCAGEIAAVANNSICGVGVAYGAQISGLRVLDGVMTDSLEAETFNKKMDVNAIYSCSWGPDDDGKTVDGPHIMAAKAMKYGVDFGRQGFGSIFVVASGNGGPKDNCNFDGYANSIYTVTIGAVDEQGHMPYYAEECASMLGVTFSSGTNMDIVTTDWTAGNPKGCTDRHTGTSAAAPIAAAMIALMLEARPCLTWRDVQYIIILTGQEIDVDVAHWQKNGVGLSHSHKHGFGLLNAWRLVNSARVWETVPWLTSFSYAKSNLDLTVPKGPDTGLTVTHTVTETDIRGLGLFIMENVQLTITLTHGCRGKIGVTLTSPSGTLSVIATPRPKDNSSDGFKDWTFTTVRCWGEEPTGNWTIQIFDHDTKKKFGEGKLKKWRLTLFGTPMTSKELSKRRHTLKSAMSGEFLDRNFSLPCPAPPKYERVYVAVSEKTLKHISMIMAILCQDPFTHQEEEREESRTEDRSKEREKLYHPWNVEDDIPGRHPTDGWLSPSVDESKVSVVKILLLTGAFCLLMAIYETLEYIFCYNDEKKEAARNWKLARRAQRLASEAVHSDNGNANSATFPDSVINGGSGINVGDDDDDEEDDIFDASESSRLLRNESRRDNSHAIRSIPEVIPLSTFSLEVGSDSAVNSCQPPDSADLPDATVEETRAFLQSEETS